MPPPRTRAVYVSVDQGKLATLPDPASTQVVLKLSSGGKTATLVQRGEATTESNSGPTAPTLGRSLTVARFAEDPSSAVKFDFKPEGGFVDIEVRLRSLKGARPKETVHGHSTVSVSVSKLQVLTSHTRDEWIWVRNIDEKPVARLHVTVTLLEQSQREGNTETAASVVGSPSKSLTASTSRRSGSGSAATTPTKSAPEKSPTLASTGTRIRDRVKMFEQQQNEDASSSAGAPAPRRSGSQPAAAAEGEGAREPEEETAGARTAAPSDEPLESVKTVRYDSSASAEGGGDVDETGPPPVGTEELGAFHDAAEDDEELAAEAMAVASALEDEAGAAASAPPAAEAPGEPHASAASEAAPPLASIEELERAEASGVADDEGSPGQHPETPTTYPVGPTDSQKNRRPSWIFGGNRRVDEPAVDLEAAGGTTPDGTPERASEPERPRRRPWWLGGGLRRRDAVDEPKARTPAGAVPESPPESPPSGGAVCRPAEKEKEPDPPRPPRDGARERSGRRPWWLGGPLIRIGGGTGSPEPADSRRAPDVALVAAVEGTDMPRARPFSSYESLFAARTPGYLTPGTRTPARHAYTEDPYFDEERSVLLSSKERISAQERLWIAGTGALVIAITARTAKVR